MKNLITMFLVTVTTCFASAQPIMLEVESGQLCVSKPNIYNKQLVELLQDKLNENSDFVVIYSETKISGNVQNITANVVVKKPVQIENFVTTATDLCVKIVTKKN